MLDPAGPLAGSRAARTGGLPGAAGGIELVDTDPDPPGADPPVSGSDEGGPVGA